jgi:PhnB protein
MPTIEAYLFFNGNCAEAMRFYEKVLGGKLSLVYPKDSPIADKLPPGSENLVLHSKLEVGGAVLMASDWMDSNPYPAVGGFAVTLTSRTTGEARTTFDKLAEGGRITMPFAKMFYSDGFGMLVDRFGVNWMVMSETNTQS